MTTSSMKAWKSTRVSSSLSSNHFSRGDIQRRKEVESAVAPVGALQASHDLAARGFNLVGGAVAQVAQLPHRALQLVDPPLRVGLFAEANLLGPQRHPVGTVDTVGAAQPPAGAREFLPPAHAVHDFLVGIATLAKFRIQARLQQLPRRHHQTLRRPLQHRFKFSLTWAAPDQVARLAPAPDVACRTLAPARRTPVLTWPRTPARWDRSARPAARRG